MIQDGVSSEKESVPVALAAHEDARQLVRLIQCTQCSRPFRCPVTLPCGNSICKECLPKAHEREHISYPDLPGRRHGIKCPFQDCQLEHPSSDCSIDVVLTKTMESIAEVMARHSAHISINPAVVEEVQCDQAVDPQAVPRQPKVHELSGARLVATYTLAAQGLLDRSTEVAYPMNVAETESAKALDINVLQDVIESTQKEVDCQVCYGIMLDPLTTYCGHTLCRKCMARVLDHSQHCPVCRRSLAIPASLFRQPSNKTLVSLLNGLCPELIIARAEAVALDERGGEGSLSVPLFVCTLGFPGQPTFLRIFEPRYRLMLRRALEGNHEFGMLMYNRYGEPQGDLGAVHFYQYGTMLKIMHAQTLSDGTSLVESRGLYRFRVKRHATVDGYSIGDVERIDDVSTTEEERIEAEETALPSPAEEDAAAQISQMSTQALHDLGQDFITRMQGRSATWLQQRVLDVHGQPPEDPALFPYWFASVLPISEEEKYKLLSTKTVRERLKITATWIRRIETQRW